MKKIISLLLVLVMVLSFAGCTPANKKDPQNNGETKYAEWVYYAFPANVNSVDPYGNTGASTEMITNITFDTLVYNNPETGAIDPELATKWESNKDMSEWTFWLEKNVKFHNGDHMTAEDVKFTYQYAANLDGATNVVKPFTAGSYAKEVKVVDEYTIKFVLKQPMPDFPSYMEMKVYSKKAIETLGHAEGSVIGTGPYYYDKEASVPAQLVATTRNENYWRGTENYKTKHIGFKIFGDLNTIVSALQAKEIDFVSVNSSLYNTVKNDPSLVVEQRTGCASYYLGFNYGSKNVNMNDVEIRRAIAQCIDKETLAAVAWEGLASVSNNFCAPSGLGYSADVKGLEYNPTAGAATLKAKGVKKLTIVYYSGATATAAEVIQASFAKLGIDVVCRQIDNSNWTSFKAGQDGYDIFLDYASYRGALLYNFNRFFYRGGSSNLFGFGSDEYEALQNKVTAQTDWENMVKEFGTLQQWVADNVPVFPLVYGNMLLGKNPNVGGGYLGGSDNACDWSTIYKIIE